MAVTVSSATSSSRRSHAQAFDEDGQPEASTSASVVNRHRENDEEKQDDSQNLLQEENEHAIDLEDDDDESLHCAICLSLIDNQTAVDPCMHDAYCFACILAWTEQSRRCPLCTRNIELLIHSIRSERDYQRYYLPPLPSKDSPPLRTTRDEASLRAGARTQLLDRPTHPRFKYADWRARNRPSSNMPEDDAEELALMKRRADSSQSSSSQHVASNRFTKYRDHSAQQVSSSAELRQRLSRWVRRELRVFEGVDLEFLTGYIVSIASQLELRSDGATRLLSEFLGERDAEHFLHEAYSFLRSPYKDIRNYDRNVQYDRPDRKIQPLLPSSPENKQDLPQSRTRRKHRRCSVSSSDSDSSYSSMSGFQSGYIIRDYRRPPRRSDRSDNGRRRSPVSDAYKRRYDKDRRSRRVGKSRTMDSYVPEYARKTRDRSEKGNRDRDNERVQASHPQLQQDNMQVNDKFSVTSPIAKENERTLTIQEHSEKVKEETIELLPITKEDSDVESIISLGADMLDDELIEYARPSIPHTTSAPSKLQISIFGRGKKDTSMNSDPTHGNTVDQESASQQSLPLNIRGTAKSVQGIPEDSLIYRLSTTAESEAVSASNQLTKKSRRSSLSDLKRQELKERLLNAKSTLPPTEPRAHREKKKKVHKGIVGDDLRSRLMTRLEEERSSSTGTEVVPSNIYDSSDVVVGKAEREEKLKQDVLSILAARRTVEVPALRQSSSGNGTNAGILIMEKAESAPPVVLFAQFQNGNDGSKLSKMEELRLRIANERAQAKSASEISPNSQSPPLGTEDVQATSNGHTNKMQMLKARMEKEKKLASLRSKLLQERAALS